MSSESPDLSGIIADGSDGDEVSNDQMEALCRIINQKTGLTLNKEKYRMRLRRKVRRKLRENDMEPAEYIRRVKQANNDEIRSLIDSVTVNETLVYRYPGQMRWLTRAAFPERFRHQPDSIRVVSAGCSTGAEPYSIAIALSEALRREGHDPEDPPFDVQIMGIDISPDALDQARTGTYGQRAVRQAPQAIRDRYFTREDKRTFSVVPALQSWTTFQRGNLLKCSLPSDSDFVFIRNVLIYFRNTERRRILRRLHTGLSPDGRIVVGHAEGLDEYRQWFRSEPEAPRGVYRRWNPGLSDDNDDDSSDSPSNNKPRITVRRRDETEKVISIEQMPGDDSSGRRLEEALYEKLNNTKEPTNRCVFDVRSLSDCSRAHLKVMARAISECLSDGAKIILRGSDDIVGELKRYSDSPWVVAGAENSDEPTTRSADKESRTENKKQKATESSSDFDIQDRFNNDRLSVRVCGDWSSDHRNFSSYVSDRIKQHSPSEVQIVLTKLTNWDEGLVPVLKRLEKLQNEQYDQLRIASDQPELATTLRRKGLDVEFRRSLDQQQ